MSDGVMQSKSCCHMALVDAKCLSFSVFAATVSVRLKQSDETSTLQGGYGILFIISAMYKGWGSSIMQQMPLTHLLSARGYFTTMILEASWLSGVM